MEQTISGFEAIGQRESWIRQPLRHVSEGTEVSAADPPLMDHRYSEQPDPNGIRSLFSHFALLRNFALKTPQ